MTPDWTDIAIPAVTLIGVTLGKGVRSLLLIIQGLFSLIWSSFAFSLSSAPSVRGEPSCPRRLPVRGALKSLLP